MDRKRIKDKNDIIGFSAKILRNRNNYVILDTETTGLGKNDVIVQLALIDLYGNVLLDSFIRPTKRKRMSEEATSIHGITMKMLINSPTFKEIYPTFQEKVGQRTLLIYNAKYDIRLIKQTAIQDEVRIEDMQAICLMKAYSIFIGEWSDYYNDYRYQKLPAGDHTAVGDCLATLKVLEQMAATIKTEIPPQWWEFWKK